MQEALVITAADIARDPKRTAQQLLELVAGMALGKRSVLLRLDFPGEPTGGLIATPRRMSWWSRIFWRVGTQAMRVSG